MMRRVVWTRCARRHIDDSDRKADSLRKSRGDDGLYLYSDPLTIDMHDFVICKITRGKEPDGSFFRLPVRWIFQNYQPAGETCRTQLSNHHIQRVARASCYNCVSPFNRISKSLGFMAMMHFLPALLLIDLVPSWEVLRRQGQGNTAAIAIIYGW